MDNFAVDLTDIIQHNHYSMKQIILAVAAATVSLGAMAEGYQVNSLSAKQIGMGHTGVAMNLGAESMFFNPGALGFMDKTLDLSGSFTAIMPTSTATIDGRKYTTDAGVSTPIGVHAAFSIFDNLKAGISFYTPYGSSINWTEDWPGAVLSQSVDLKVMTVQPTVSWRVIPKLSIGAGLMISWGNVDLNKGLVSASSLDRMMAVMQATGQLPAGLPPFGETTPASVNLTGTADVAVGVNVGAMYEINRQWNVGASFRTEMKMKVGAGTASVSYANEVARQILESKVGLINQANFKASMPCPWVLSLGTSYKPIDNLILAFDARLTGWHTYKSLDIEFLNPSLEGFNQHIEKNYSNSWCFSLGGQYSVTKRFDVRLGLMVDTTPVNSNYYNPETPGMTKVEPTAGLSFRPLPSLSIDLGFMYIHGCGKKGASVTYEDLIGKTMIGTLGEQAAGQLGFSSTCRFTADYKLHAFAPSIGISYSF